MPFHKLDYIVDTLGYISMVIYNTHPDGYVFIAPKYYPSSNGPWHSRERGTRYQRFEYYWNLRTRDANAPCEKVYDLDKDPKHAYDTSVVEQFPGKLVQDPCHGVPMYMLPVGRVAEHHDAMAAYRALEAGLPAHLERFGSLLHLVEDHVSPDALGLTGSYLYGIYQDFSDLNIVVYDARAMQGFYELLASHGGLETRTDVSLIIPPHLWMQWQENTQGIEKTSFYEKNGSMITTVTIRDRFIGSLHDEDDPGTRIGFWNASREDPDVYGTFRKRILGAALISCKVMDWKQGMATGAFPIEAVSVLGRESTIPSGTVPRRILVIGQFNRMFIFDENVHALGLIQEVTRGDDGSTIEHELLVGGREIGGWVVPDSILFDETD